ncbi:MAG: hypothetical protein K0Q51_769 [Rickettsiaceae bacterium]|jgi:hypothetical protein|nr:hypothetical protein [Rickettsiaceae bacterium]
MPKEKLHSVLAQSNLLSDHIKQIADFSLANVTIRIVTHNMLNKCHNEPWPDNAWNIAENAEQYSARLKLLAQEYKNDISHGATIVALQEAPRGEIAESFFNSMNLKTSWKFEVRETGDTDEQALMFIYNESVTGEIQEVAELLDQRANSYRFKINGQEVNFINVHIPYGASFDDKLPSTVFKLQELMKIEENELKIRFGDHNANTSRYKDLLVWQKELPTSLAYNIKTKEFSFIDDRDGNLYKNYDGFAVSDNYQDKGYSYTLYPSQLVIPNTDSNAEFTVTSVPNLPQLGALDEFNETV